MQGVGNVTRIIGGDALYGASDNIERLGPVSYTHLAGKYWKSYEKQMKLYIHENQISNI